VLGKRFFLLLIELPAAASGGKGHRSSDLAQYISGERSTHWSNGKSPMPL
jgi:hypothetical protein